MTPEEEIARLKQLLIESETRRQAEVKNLSEKRLFELESYKLSLAAQAEEIERLEGLPRSGLYGKYIIQKADGSPMDQQADYFVLRLDADPVARKAALEYSYTTPDRDLALGLQERIGRYNPAFEDCRTVRFYGMEKPEAIKRLEEETSSLLRLAHKQRAALKKLGEKVRTRGEALVEERANMMRRGSLLKEDYDAARKQLRAEGVIGK